MEPMHQVIKTMHSHI